MNLHELDDELLAELIEKCEAAMAKPFKKSKPQVKVEIEQPEEEEVAEDEPKDDDSKLDLEELMRAYESRK
jgi:phenylpyruvate tautomerase PptA (4-oxalocrotonate tautomerase family)